ncbi:LysR substrate-binding domain-containing protein [Neoroseomonas lacus]|uniref:LysR substrate-binding domain-containing protein n=1 Tax=Neoroseomonas lacus TaxID=287609 RepID=UPI001666E379|nr:LysR substrate-binding domain-containing protein [Neoroseomonas lacus]
MPNRARLPLGALRAFESVARLGGVRRAALELCVTEGAVSQQLRTLEVVLGVPLVSRGPDRRLTLTEEGTAMLRRLTPAFDLMESATRDAMTASGPQRLRVRMLPTLAIRWLVPRLGQFFERHGDINIEVSTAAERAAALRPDDDFVAWQGDGSWRGVHAELLFHDALVPVCSSHLARTAHEPAALRSATLLHSMLRPEAWRIWLDGAGVEGVDATAGRQFANASLAYQAAMDGLGVAIAQRVYVEADLKSGRLVAPFERTVVSGEGYYLICEAERASLPRHQAFLSWIRDCVRKDMQKDDREVVSRLIGAEPSAKPATRTRRRSS